MPIAHTAAALLPAAATADAAPSDGSPRVAPLRAATRLRSGLVRAADLFAWPLRVSHYLELANPLWSSHALRARVVALRDETEDARTVVLRPGRGWRSPRAGQFVTVTVTVAGRRHVRTYSISTAPGGLRDDLAITVKAIPGGVVSQHLAHAVSVGDYVTLGLPQGEFVLPESAPVRPLFLTAGSGITPVMAMLREAAACGTLDDVVHVHWAPRTADVIFAEDLARLAREFAGYRLHVVTTREEDAGQGAAARRFSATLLDERCPDWRRRDVWACGPRGLLREIEAHWSAVGLAPRLRVERFQAPLAATPPDAAGGRVCFRRSAVALDADGATPLLRVAEAAGLNPAHGCRMGICHTCTATLVAGAVRDVRDNRFTTEPGAKVQVCVTAAAGGCELDL